MVLTADKLTKEYGGATLFKNLSFTVDKGDRIGIVGRNGCGKTTLLKILLNEEPASSGNVSMQSGSTLGYLPQCPVELDDRTLWDFMLEVFDREISMERELDRLAVEMESGSIDVQKRYSNLLHEFELLEGYGYESRIHKILSGLGFGSDRYEMSMAEFSGGWRTRAYLARLLLEEPDVLILDEPTNHLDVDSLAWLERFLKGWKKALVMVSHDRAFLNGLCNRIWSMTDECIQYYNGNYDQFQLLRSARFEERMKTWKAQREHVERTEDFIRRHLAGQRTKEAQGRRKKLMRFIKEEAITKPTREKGVSIRFADVDRSGEQVLNSTKMTIGYDGVPLAEIPKLDLLSRNRLAVLGPNGCGKSTLFKTWLGDVSALAGSFSFGTGVKIGYMSQTLTELTPGLNLVDAIREAQKRPDDADARHVLGGLGFSGDDVFKTVDDLSGGERSRVAIARLALRGANLLFLDEPTNHLDVESQELLQRVLSEYPGTLIVISHDRYLIRALANRVLMFGNGGDVAFFEGGLDEYEAFTQDRNSYDRKQTVTPQKDDDKSRRRNDFTEDKRRKNEIRRMQRRFDDVESLIHELEEKKESVETLIGEASSASDMDKLTTLTNRLAGVGSELTRLYDEWETLGEALE